MRRNKQRWGDDDDDDGYGFDTVVFTRRAAQVHPKVTFMSGDEIHITAQTTDTVANLKRKISQQSDHPAEMMDLFLADSEKALQNEWKLAQCNIESSTQLYAFNRGEEGRENELGEDETLAYAQRACQAIEAGEGCTITPMLLSQWNAATASPPRAPSRSTKMKISAGCPGKIVLHSCALRPDDVRQIAEALMADSALVSQVRELHLSGNGDIGDSGAQALAAMLRVNKTLTGLALGGTGVTATGVIALANALSQNKRRSNIHWIALDARVLRSKAVAAAFDELSRDKIRPQSVALRADGYVPAPAHPAATYCGWSRAGPARSSGSLQPGSSRAPVLHIQHTTRVYHRAVR
eukprot:g1391.t1